MEVKAILHEELTKKFKAIKKAYGLKNTSEVIRFCINSEYKSILKKKRTS